MNSGNPNGPNNDLGVVINMANAGNTTLSSGDLTNYFGRGAVVTANLTGVTAGNVTVKVDGKDGGTGTYYNLLTSAILAATGATTVTVYPALSAVSNVVVSAILPPIFRVEAVVSTTGNITGNIGVAVVQ